MFKYTGSRNRNGYEKHISIICHPILLSPGFPRLNCGIKLCPDYVQKNLNQLLAKTETCGSLQQTEEKSQENSVVKKSHKPNDVQLCN